MTAYKLSKACLLIAALVFVLPADGVEISGAPVVVNEQQALKLFFERNIDLIMAHYNIERGAAEQIIAAALPNPNIDGELSEINEMIWSKQVSSNTGNRWPQGGFPAWMIRIEQMIITAGKRTLRMESSELGTQALEYDLRDTVRVLSNALRHAYYNLLLAQKTADLAQANLERYRNILRANKTRLDIGDIAGYDYTRIEVEALKAENDVATTQADVKRAQAELLLLLGWPENAVTIRATEQWPAFNTDKSRKSQPELVQQALDKRPDLSAAKIRVAQADKNRELAKQMVIPDVTLHGYYLKDPGNFFTNQGGAGFKSDLPLLYRQEGEIASAEVELNKAHLFIRQSEQSIRGEVMKTLAAWKKAETITQRFEHSVISRIEALRKSAEIAYQKGASGFLELLDAERNYKAMMQEYYNTLANRSAAWADLIMATGEEVR